MRLPAALLVALLGMVAAASARSADQSAARPAPSITVSASAEVVVNPDRATVTLAVDSEGSTSAAAAADNARVTEAVSNALLAAGVARSDLVTTNYMVQAQWQYSNNNPPKRTGYQAHNTLLLAVGQLAALGPGIDAALAAGATRVENVEFDSSAASSARREALSMAVANAKQDAETLAKAAGGKLGALQELTTVGTGGPQPLMATLNMPAQREKTYIEPSPLHISAAVTGRWLFQP
jgi:uncharacterized protein YggE